MITTRFGDPGLYRRALEFAAKAHAGQSRKFGGGAYITHPIRVAALCATLDVEMSFEGIAGALLHDVAEDTEATFSDVDEHFPPQTTQVVQDMTKAPEESKEDYLRRVLLRPLCRFSPVIKLCDRIDNLTDSWSQAPERWRQRYLAQTQTLLGLAAGSQTVFTDGYRLRDHPALGMLTRVAEELT